VWSSCRQYGRMSIAVKRRSKESVAGCGARGKIESCGIANEPRADTRTMDGSASGSGPVSFLSFDVDSSGLGKLYDRAHEEEKGRRGGAFFGEGAHTRACQLCARDPSQRFDGRPRGFRGRKTSPSRRLGIGRRFRVGTFYPASPLSGSPGRLFFRYDSPSR
jgi:hypothetical protein